MKPFCVLPTLGPAGSFHGAMVEIFLMRSSALSWDMFGIVDGDMDLQPDISKNLSFIGVMDVYGCL